MLKEKNTSRLFKMSIKLCRQQVVSHPAFDQHSRGEQLRATAESDRCAFLRSREFFWHTSAWHQSQAVHTLSDTFLAGEQV